MLYQDSVLKENWTFRRGELYMVDHKRGQRPRESTVEISVVLWPEEQTETSKWYMVVPITVDTTGRDPETDVVIRDKRDIGRPYAATLVHAHMVAEYPCQPSLKECSRFLLITAKSGARMTEAGNYGKTLQQKRGREHARDQPGYAGYGPGRRTDCIRAVCRERLRLFY